jgi:hypothetical protein
MEALRCCPFCGADVNNDPVAVTQISADTWAVTHMCAINYERYDFHRAVSCYGRNREEAVARWNHRA